MAGLVCPHCGMVLALTGKGSKAIIKVKGAVKPFKVSPDPDAPPPPPKERPIDILGPELYEPYWALALQFGKIKNLKACDSARAYLRLVREHGWTVETIKHETEKYLRLTEEKRYLRQMSVWLDSLTELPPTPDEDPNGDSRLHARQHAT